MGFSLRLHDFLLTQAFLAQGPARTPSHGALEPEKPYALSAHRSAMEAGLRSHIRSVGSQIGDVGRPEKPHALTVRRSAM